MAIVRERTKTNYVENNSGVAATAINQFRFVKSTAGVTAGSEQFSQADTQGEVVKGICLNSPAIGEMAQIADEGICEVEAAEAFNAGTELMTTANGRAMTATAGYFVRAWAQEASSHEGHLVRVKLVEYYVYGTR